MSFNQDGPFLAFPTNGDLSTKQKLAVVLNATGTLDVAGANVRCLGILIDDPKSGKTGTVQTRDVAKVLAGAAITQGAFVTSDASGRAVTATTGQIAWGQALQSVTAANQIVAVRLSTPGSAAP